MMMMMLHLVALMSSFLWTTIGESHDGGQVLYYHKTISEMNGKGQVDTKGPLRGLCLCIDTRAVA